MKKNSFKGSVRTSVLFCAVTLCVPVTGFAYNLELSSTSGNLVAGEYYSMDVVFNGTETDNLETVFSAIGWNTDIVTFAGAQTYDYERQPTPFTSYTLWNGSEFDYVAVTPDGASEAAYIYNLNGAENLYHPDEFYPVASEETLMATIWFEADVTGTYSDIASFIYADDDDQIWMANGDSIYQESTAIWNEGDSSFFAPEEFAPSAVPVPTTGLLLGSGLLGLAGLRRRRA